MRNKILVKRRLLELTTPSENYAYLVAKLINQFGVFVDKPELLSNDNVKTIAEFYDTTIPNGFYKNPQDLKYFTTDELLLEQLISYINISVNGEYSIDENVFERIELFSKVLPNYRKGSEINLRKYSLITSADADKFLKELAVSFCNYSRPWSTDEFVEFKWLYLNGFYNNQYIKCRDNVIDLFLEFKNIEIAKMLDKKDVVKMSISKYGKCRNLDIPDEDKIVFDIAINNASNCPMSLSQSKYYNSLLKNLKSDNSFVDNSNSPFKEALALLKNGDVVGASKVFANNGSLLERNLVFLLSRANFEEASQIIDMLKADNPIVLMQLLVGIINDDYSSNRTFSFYSNKTLKTHYETEKEFKYRKSRLTIGMKKHLINKIDEKIKSYYSNKPRLGKIFISDEFKRVGIPFNTSAMGMGLDVLPTGSRLDITADYIRTFCYWHKLFDVDMSVIFINKKGEQHTFYWGNYSKKLFGKSALSSGDNRKKDGAEFNDFRINELKELGYTKAIVVLNGYGGKLDKGEIYCGYQNKEDLETQAWQPNNIALKIHVKGDTYCYVAFAIDFETNEIIIVNQNISSNNIVVDEENIVGIKRYLDKNYIENFNMYKIICNLGEVVDNIQEADIIFASESDILKHQKLIKPFEIEKLVELLK